MRRRRFQDTGDTAEVNLSPMIDVVFLLLIFFVVTSVFVVETGVEVALPRAAAPADLDRKGIRVAVTEGGRVVHDGREIGVEGVRPLLVRLNRDGARPVVVEADGAVPTRLLVAVIDEANLGGAASVHLATRKEGP